jgi:nicotinate-nucleotide adenylyltransferase
MSIPETPNDNAAVRARPPRIGFLGGTFDPPHEGHVRLARLAQQRLGLERVLLAPAGVQPLKVGEGPVASWQQRLRMVQLAVAGMGGLEASDIDAPRPGGMPNYSVDTLVRVAEQHPGAQIFFLMGADAFQGLRRWHDPVGLLQLCDLAVASRPGLALPEDGNALLEWMPEGSRFLGKEEMQVRQQAPGTRHQLAEAATTQAEAATADLLVFLAGSALVRVALLEDLAEDIAATLLRAELARGAGFGWLPGGADGKVAEYVRAEGLYSV